MGKRQANRLATRLRRMTGILLFLAVGTWVFHDYLFQFEDPCNLYLVEKKQGGCAETPECFSLHESFHAPCAVEISHVSFHPDAASVPETFIPVFSAKEVYLSLLRPPIERPLWQWPCWKKDDEKKRIGSFDGGGFHRMR